MSDASLDMLSGGRFEFGIGGGWNVEEMNNHGVEYKTRFKQMREHIEAMKPLVEDLEVHMLEDCGHWSQQEQPDAVNRLMIDWLKRTPA